jgi:amino acid transporter
MISSLMERLYGTTAGAVATLLIIWTAFASVFSLLLGYSRVPYAAALDGNYFKVFAKIHPTKRFPFVSLLTLGVFAALFCFFKLADIIAAMVVIRILIQFLAQIVGLLILRRTRPEFPRPFKMWLYPVPALIAITGFLFVLFSRPNFQRELKYAAVLLIIGLIIYFVRALIRNEYPFSPRPEVAS